jgi:hypothetical protein
LEGILPARREWADTGKNRTAREQFHGAPLLQYLDITVPTMAALGLVKQGGPG